MYLNLSSIVCQPIQEQTKEEIMQHAIENQYQNYLCELQQQQQYLDLLESKQENQNISNSQRSIQDDINLEQSKSQKLSNQSIKSNQNIEPVKSTLNFEQASKSQLYEQISQGLQNKEMTQIKLLQLSNTLQKQKTLIKSTGQVITSLNLSNNMIDTEFIKINKKVLSELLQQNKISQVDFSRNNMDTEGLEILVQVLKQNQWLKTLNLSNNQINSDHAEVLCGLFQIKQIEIDLSNNELKDQFFNKIFLHTQKEEFNVQKLIVKNCQLTNRVINQISNNLKKLPILKQIVLIDNLIDDFEALQELETKLLVREKMNKFNKHQPTLPKFELQQDSGDLHFQDINDLLTLKYIFQNTKLIIDERALIFCQDRIDHIFPKQSKILAKFLSIHHKSVNQIQQSRDLSSPSKQDKQKTVQLAASPLQQSLVTASIELVQQFRDIVLYNNITLLDLSCNYLADASINRGLNLLKLCSHKLSVLKLDGNLINFYSLQSLHKLIEKLGIKGIQVLSLKQCDLKCNCNNYDNLSELEFQEKAINQKCPLEMLMLLMSVI